MLLIEQQTQIDLLSHSLWRTLALISWASDDWHLNYNLHGVTSKKVFDDRVNSSCYSKLENFMWVYLYKDIENIFYFSTITNQKLSPESCCESDTDWRISIDVGQSSESNDCLGVANEIFCAKFHTSGFSYFDSELDIDSRQFVDSDENSNCNDCTELHRREWISRGMDYNENDCPGVVKSESNNRLIFWCGNWISRHNNFWHSKSNCPDYNHWS